MDYEKNPKASTGAFELAYKGTPVLKTDRPTTSNEYASSSEKGPSALKEDKKKSKPAPALLIKDIGYGMRQTLEDLLGILRKEMQKRQKNKKQSIATIASFTTIKINQSVETITSKTGMVTQTESKIKIIEFDSQNNLISSYHIKSGKNMKNEETNTVKYSKDYILNLLRKKVIK